MHEQYLGDSYDLVKRFWCESLESIAPLYVHPRFVHETIRGQYTLVTRIPIRSTRAGDSFGLLLDPDTGIPLPHDSPARVASTHVSLQFIVDVFQELTPVYMICFDQSYHRKHELDREAQREMKRAYLREHGIHAFYYVSHAPFLFMAQNTDTLRTILGRLISLGIPKARFHPPEASD